MKKTLLIVVALLCLCMLVACGASVAKDQATANGGTTVNVNPEANDALRQHGTYELLVNVSGDENTPATTNTVTILLGDVNGDGKITNQDILLMYKNIYNSTLNPLPTITQTEHALISHDAKAPTCTEKGWERYTTCSCCDQTTYVEIPATGHSEVYHAAKEPTYTQVGWEAYVTCKNCDYTTYVELPVLPPDENQPFYTEGLQFTLNADNASYSVSKYNGILPEVIIPETYEGLPVTEITQWAFEYCTHITSVYIPTSVTAIWDEAFIFCSELREVVIPCNVKYIGIGAFAGCSSLSNIVVDVNNPEFSTLDGNLFNKDQTALLQYMPGKTEKEYIIPDSVTSICGYAFYESVLEHVTIPDGVVNIDDSAFYSCLNLKSVTIPANVMFIGYDAFGWCPDLETVYYKGMAEEWGSIMINGGNEYLIDANLISIYYTEGLEFALNNDNASYSVIRYNGVMNEVVIPTVYNRLPVTAIADWSFADNMNLSRVIIPDSITSIGNSAFFNCILLNGIMIGSSVEHIGDNAFSKCESLGSIEIPDSVTSIGNYVFSDCYSLRAAIIGNGVPYISNGMFCSCDGLEVVVIGNNVTYIGEMAFAECSSLKDILIPSSVVSIGDMAFQICSSLTRIEIPDSVSYVGSRAFLACENLNSITIGKGVTYIGDYAFFGCTGLKTVYYTGREREWLIVSIDVGNEDMLNAEFISLYYTDGLQFTLNGAGTEYSVRKYSGSATDVVIPAVYNGLPVTSVGYQAFKDCTSVLNVTIPDSVTTISSYAFSYCTGLEAITIGSGVKTVGEGAFQAADYIIKVFYTGDVEGWLGITFTDTYSNPMSQYYGTRLYFGGDLVTEVTIPTSVTAISDNAFRGCSSLKSVIIHEGVTSIGFRAFHNCTSLESVTIGNGVTSIGVMAFAKCQKLKTVNMGNSVKTIGQSAFDSCTSLESLVIPKSVTSIGDQVIFNCTSLKTVYYTGTEAEWNTIRISYTNSELYSVTKVYNYAQ